MKVVEFLRPSLPYNTGDRAAFDDGYADQLVASGIAVLPQADGPNVHEQPKLPERDRAVRSYAKKA